MITRIDQELRRRRGRLAFAKTSRAEDAKYLVFHDLSAAHQQRLLFSIAKPKLLKVELSWPKRLAKFSCFDPSLVLDFTKV